MSKRFAGFALLLVLAACSKKTPDRKSFQAAWDKARDASDGDAAWKMVDKASKAKLVAGAEKMTAAAKADKVRKALIGCVIENVEVDQSPAALARALFGAVWKDAAVVDDGATTRIHVEDGGWKVALDPVGFVDPDGAPVTLGLSLEAVAPVGPKPASEPKAYDFTPQWNGKNDEQIRADVAGTVGGLDELKKIPGYVPLASRLIACDLTTRANGAGRAVEFAYHLELGGSVTPIIGTFQENDGSVKTEPAPRLAYGSWP